MGSRLQKVKEALKKNIGGKSDPEVEANYNAGYRESKLQAAKTAGKRAGRKAGLAMGARNKGITGMFSNAASKANSGMEFLNTDFFGDQTPNTTSQAKKRIKKSSKRGTTTIKVDGHTITVGNTQKKRKQPPKKKTDMFNYDPLENM